MSDKQPEMMVINQVCAACGATRQRMHGTALEPWVCERCEWRYPPALLKALIDSFDYALKLRTGEIFRFQEATLHGEWLHLRTGESREGNDFRRYGGNKVPYPYPFDRGVDVRVADIVWIADAPEGS